jgi:hypothetical protein
LLPFVATPADGSPGNQGQVWQADIQIRVLEVVQSKSQLNARVLVYSGNERPALDARLLVFVPVGAGLDRMPQECVASPAPSNVPSLRATIQCQLGTIPAGGLREVSVRTTVPPAGLAKRIGAFAFSDTPDPQPSNNYAERVVP